MSKSRSRGKVRPTHSAVPPEEGSKGYIRVLKRGCGGYQSNHPLDPVEYDCRHDYGWACDECPLVVEANMDKEAEWVHELLTIQGPHRRKEQDDEFWKFPAVATELCQWYSPEEINKWETRYNERKAEIERLSVARSGISDRTLSDLFKA